MSTDPSEFERYHEQLMAEAPDGYEPWYFRVESGAKNPDTKYGSWKDDSSKLSFDEAMQWLRNGGNVGVAGTADDRLVNVDIDDDEKTAVSDLKPTLLAKSRSREGYHAFYFSADDEDIPNIPTDNAGEVRTSWQYVLAPGSYVETDPDEVPESERDNAGYYTVEKERTPATLAFDELPEVFIETHERNEKERQETDDTHDYTPPENTGNTSALFDISARDVVRNEGGDSDPSERWSSLFHDSDTSSNMALSDQGKLQCFRHNVTHNGLQALVVFSRYISNGNTACERVGTPHSNSGGAPSCMKGDDGAIWHAWKYAKENGYTPDDDPVPYRALCHIASEMGIASDEEIPDRGEYDPDNGARLPAYAYNSALAAIENKHGLDTGRSAVGGGGAPTISPDTDTDEVDSIPKPNPSEFECQNGCYGYTEEVKNAAREVTNEKWVNGTTFEIETRSFIVEDDGATVTVELTIHPSSNAETPYEVTVPIDVFTEPRTFRQEVATGRTTTFDLGTQFLNKIRRFVGGQDAPVRVPTRHIGLHGTEFVTPDGVLTADGWASDPDTVLIDNDTTVPQKWQLSTEDGVEYDTDDVADILEALPQTRSPDRFLPVLGWFYAAPVRPLIMQWTGEFNVLNITGDTGAGKTATVGVLWELFGMDGEPLSADGTAFTRLTAFSSSNAVPVWFDEFKPAEMTEYQQDTFMSMLRKSTRGGTEPKGNADQTEDQWHLRAPTVVSGEQLISGPAEERRSIQTVFTSAVTDEDTDEYRQFARLSGGDYVDSDGNTVYCDGYDLADHARAYYTWLLGEIEDDDTLKRQWNRAGEQVTDLLADNSMNVHPTVKQGYQTVLFGCWLYRGFCEHIGADARAAGVTDDQVTDAIVAVADTGTGHEHVSHLDRLLGVASRAAAADYLEEGEHYKVVDPRDRGGEELRLKLPTAFDEIRRYAREYDVADGDLLDSASDYRTRIQDDEDSDDSVVVASSVKTYELNRTCAFSIPVASERIEDFERALWTGDEYDPSTGEGTNLTPKQAVESVVMQNGNGGMERPIILAELFSQHDIDPETGQNAIDTAVSEGRVVDRDNTITAE